MKLIKRKLNDFVIFTSESIMLSFMASLHSFGTTTLVLLGFSVFTLYYGQPPKADESICVGIMFASGLVTNLLSIFFKREELIDYWS